jgi:hypothetical protein
MRVGCAEVRWSCGELVECLFYGTILWILMGCGVEIFCSTWNSFGGICSEIGVERFLELGNGCLLIPFPGIQIKRTARLETLFISKGYSMNQRAVVLFSGVFLVGCIAASAECATLN